jgi:hypothetical protein
LWILREKYPESLLEFCSAIPAEARPDVPLFALAEAVARSKPSDDKTTEALAGICDRLEGYSRQRAVLQQLANINQERCIALVQPLMAKLPQDVDEPYWTCAAAGYSHVFMELEQDAIWREYLKVARRAAVGLRMEMMNPMDYSYIGAKNRNRRLAFLAAFLDDSTVRDSSVNAGKYEGPCAAFTFDKIEVRDFAAMKIASILQLKERPTEFWTSAQWAELRRKVRAELEREQLPALSLVAVEAEVVRYIPQALHEDHEDGGFATFDAVEFKIASPPKWRGKKLRVYCNPGTKNPVFQSAGITCRFEIDEKYLVGSSRDPATGDITTFMPFDSALKDFRQVE